MAYVWKYECAKRSAMCERGDAQMEPVIGTIEKEVDCQEEGKRNTRFIDFFAGSEKLDVPRKVYRP